jgi:hypothetical protein
MKHTPVSSSFIDSIGYDSQLQELHVAMANGKTYSYSEVSPAEHEAFINAESIGAHYGKHIKATRTGHLVKAA